MRRAVAFLLIVLSVGMVAARTGSAARAGPAPPPKPRLILTPLSSKTLFTFEGLYPQKKKVCDFKQPKPLRAKYRGRLELVLRDDGSVGVIDALSFSNYLRGLAEVPPSWPIEALEAQVIAARSYALQSLRATQASAASRGYDICSTDQCQVYRGASIELGAFGNFGKCDLDREWTPNAEKCPTIIKWLESVGARFGKVQLLRMSPNTLRECRWAPHK